MMRTFWAWRLVRGTRKSEWLRLCTESVVVDSRAVGARSERAGQNLTNILSIFR